MEAIVVARVDVGIAGVIVAEGVRDSQRVFHDEALKKSLFFGTMCERCSGSHTAFGRTGYSCTDFRLSVLRPATPSHNTFYAHLWGFSQPSNQTLLAEGRRCLVGRPAECPKVGGLGLRV